MATTAAFKVWRSDDAGGHYSDYSVDVVPGMVVLDAIEKLRQRASMAAVYGHREYNPGWHTALDLRHLLTVSEAIARCAIERKESRGGHFREDFPEKAPEFSTINMVVHKRPDGSMELRRIPLPEMPAELKQIIDENR